MSGVTTLVSQDSPVTAGNSCPMRRPCAVGNSCADLYFIRILDRLAGDYASAAVLYALLARQADLFFVPLSQRKLSALLGGRVIPRTVVRALASLEGYGLLERQEHPNTTTRYRVRVEALHALLSTPLPEAEVIPGITPLPALARMFEAPNLPGAEGGCSSPRSSHFPLIPEGNPHD